MSYEMSDEEFKRIRRSMGAGATMTREKAEAFAARLLIERAMEELVAPPAGVEDAALGKRFFLEELEELLGLDERPSHQLRRIAELTEIVYDDAEARPWWERAADAGDEDAVAYLQELIEEDGK